MYEAMRDYGGALSDSIWGFKIFRSAILRMPLNIVDLLVPCLDTASFLFLCIDTSGSPNPR